MVRWRARCAISCRATSISSRKTIPPDNCGIDICLSAVSPRPTGAPSGRESRVRDRRPLFRQSSCATALSVSSWFAGPSAGDWSFDPADVLTLVVTARGDIDRVLAVWDTAPDPAAAIHMAALREDVLHHAARTHFHSPYLDEFPEAADKIGAFLMRPQTIPRIEATFFMVTDPRLQQLLSDAIHLA